jgi:hypothetical protein
MSAASRSMARRRDDLARNLGSGPSANDNHTGPCASSALPLDALAVIEPVPLATNQGGRSRCGQWRVRFAPRWRPVADPLTMDRRRRSARDDRAALSRPGDRSGYCRRQGLRFSIHGEPRGQRPLQRNRRRCCTAGRQVRMRVAAAPIRSGAKEHDCHARFSLAG